MNGLWIWFSVGSCMEVSLRTEKVLHVWRFVPHFTEKCSDCSQKYGQGGERQSRWLGAELGMMALGWVCFVRELLAKNKAYQAGDLTLCRANGAEGPGLIKVQRLVAWGQDAYSALFKHHYLMDPKKGKRQVWWLWWVLPVSVEGTALVRMLSVMVPNTLKANTSGTTMMQ